MIYEILDEKGNIENIIIAEQDFVEKYYSGKYRDITPNEPVIGIEVIDPIKVLETKVDVLIAKVDTLLKAMEVKSLSASPSESPSLSPSSLESEVIG